MNPILIRDAKAEDADMVAAVHVDTWRTAYRGIVAQEYLDGLSYQKRQQGFLRLLANPEVITIVAQEPGGKVIGFASGGRNMVQASPYAGQIFGIYVLQEAQRRGIGRMLVSAICRQFVERSLTSMAISVLEDNLPARSFYERIGGKYESVELFHVGQQDLRAVTYGWKDIRDL